MTAVWASHHEELCSDGVVAPPVCATGVSLIARGCLSGATPRGSAVDVCSAAPARAQRLSAWRMAVLSTCRAPSLCRQMHRELLRSAWLDLTPTIPVTACH